MSFSLFEQGFSPAEIKQIKAKEAENARLADQHARWAECERVLAILRPISPTKEPLNDKALQLWLAAVSP